MSHRFFCPQADFTLKTVDITDKDELHHLRYVLRLKENAKIALFDGRGHEAAGTIVSISPKKTQVAVTTVHKAKRKTPKIILACAIPKKSKFEMIIEKATELGADEIIPLKTHRTEINLKGDRLTSKLSRYQTVALNAVKQSQRSMIPIIHPITDFKSCLNHLTGTTITMIPSLLEKKLNLLEALQTLTKPKAVSFLIGPEGDFTPEEYEQAYKLGCIPVTLGKTVLKVETAALCVLSCANLYFHTK